MISQKLKVKSQKNTIKIFFLAKKSIAFAAALFMFCILSFGQKVTTNIDRRSIVIGQQTTLTLKVEEVSNSVQNIAQWFVVPDTLNHLEVISRGEVEKKSESGFTVFEQKIILTSFDSGTWQLPQFPVTIQSSAQRINKVLQSKPDSISVFNANVTDVQDYHPIKEIIIEDKKLPYLLVAGIVVGIFLLGLLIFWLVNRNKKLPIVQKINRKNAAAEALEKLKALQTSYKEKTIGNAGFYTSFDVVMRQFVATTLQVGALQKTTDEYMILIQPYFLETKETFTGLYQAFRLSDAVKFAKYEPPTEEADIAIAAAQKFIQFVTTLNNNTHA